MTTLQQGQRGEQRAAEWLVTRGFVLLQRNFKRPYCEIDIVAGRQRIIYFVEVKYRSSQTWGDGLDYITTQKLHHMQRAARVWVEHNRWNGEYRLAAVAVTGPGRVTDFIEID